MYIYMCNVSTREEEVRFTLGPVSQYLCTDIDTVSATATKDSSRATATPLAYQKLSASTCVAFVFGLYESRRPVMDPYSMCHEHVMHDKCTCDA